MSTNCELNIDCLNVINYAIQQNRIPIVRNIQLFNGTESVIEKCGLHLSFTPKFAQDIDIPVGDVKAGAGVTINDIPIILSGEYLSSMTERVVGKLDVKLLSNGDAITEKIIPLELRTFDEWPGEATYPEILASFVTPNHPAIQPIIKRASEILENWGVNAAIDAYYTKNAEKVKYMMAAIFEAIKEYQISYCWVPACSSPGGQRIRLAHTILGDKLACCLDMACMYASCLEAAGLKPIIVIQKEHAFAGCHLIDRLMQDPSIDDGSLLMKLCAEGINEMMVVETTSMTEGCIRSFDEAVALANSELADIDNFSFAVDIARSRLAHIDPLPLSIDGTIDPSLMTTEVNATELPSGLSDIDNIDLDSASIVTKQHIWERHLLDLSLNNRLLNTHLSKESIQLMVTDIQELEDAFANGKSFHISHIPVEWVATGARAAMFNRIASADPVRGLIATDMKQQQRLHSFLKEDQMKSALKQLAYKSRTSMEECGANSLYLTMGLLRFADVETGNTLYAPIILYPVDLERKNATSGYVVKSRGEEPVLNNTLIEYLRQFYQVRISGLDPLPKDGNGIDISMILNTFRRAVLNKKGWDVEEHVILGIFSFSKQVMWNDIHYNSALLDSNPIVRSLEEGKLDPSMVNNDPKETDSSSAVASKLILPLDADSSQENVINEALRGESFVVYGAPGTGKSQTIANIIANTIYRGKRVLFVAEKKAALDVVMKHLEVIGISDFCLALHSNKTSKAYVLEHFKRLLNKSKDYQSIPYSAQVEKYTKLESELGNHVNAINHVHQVGFSLNDCISGYFSNDSTVISRLVTKDWNNCALDYINSALDEYRNACNVVGDLKEHPFSNSELTSIPSTDLRPQMEQMLIEIGALKELWLIAWSGLFTGIVAKTGKDAFIAFSRLCDALDGWHPVRPHELISLSREQMESAKTALRYGLRYYKTKQSILSKYSEGILDNSCYELKNKLKEVKSKEFFAKFVSEMKLRNEISYYSLSGERQSISDISLLAKQISEMETDEKHILESESLLKSVFGDKWNSNYDNDWESMITDIDKASIICNMINLLSSSDTEYCDMCDSISTFLSAPNTYDSKDIFRTVNTKSEYILAAYNDVCVKLAITLSNSDNLLWLDFINDSIETWYDNYDCIREIVIYNSKRSNVIKLGLEKFVNKVEQGDLEPDNLLDCFMKSFYGSYANHIISTDPSLSLFHGLIFEDKANKYRHLHDEVQELACLELRNHLLQSLPAMQQEATNGNEALILQKNIRNGCRGISIRNLFAQIPDLLSKMCPCMLMSPLSVAQYLTPDGPKFDLVIFDEASQIPTCEAIGAIARGKSVVVVGDPNQMPPSDFFTADSFDEENAYIEDLESILDDCLALSMPSRHLLWHYRSKHESLIAFSNMHFYDNKLLTFPSTDDLTTRLHFKLLDGTYDRGRSRQNSAEADAIVEEIKQRLSDASTADKSIGVVTFNSSQQSLIEDRLNDMFKKNPSLEKIAMKQTEPIFIKNLENVQGDERDVILISIGYGLDKNGVMSLNFGPLNKDGGWRRLNVAVSRARYEMIVFSTITSDQIDLNRSSSEGVAGLKAFLEYAEKGRDALRYNTAESVKTDDGIVLSIAKDLKDKGFTVKTNVGCSGYRIDLGIVDPKNPDKFIAGILCDGYNYAAAKTTKDREVLQIKILELLGWNICRVWALDYWSNREKTVIRLVEQLNKIIAENDSKVECEPTPVETANKDTDDSQTVETGESSLQDEVHEFDSDNQEISFNPSEAEEPDNGVPSFDETETIVQEMLTDEKEYEVKEYFEPIIEKISSDGFRSQKEDIYSIIKQYGEMPSAAINAINEFYFELLGDNLISEEGEELVMNSDNYNKIKE